MNDEEAGWYPDPTGQNQLRFWDGDSWTDYYAPILPEEDQDGPDLPSRDYPYLAQAAPWAYHHDPRDRPPSEGGPPSRGLRGTPGAVAAVIAIVVLALVITSATVWWLSLGGTPAGGPPRAAPGSGPTTTGVLSQTEQTSATLEAGGVWEGSLALTDSAVVLVDVRGEGERDLAVEIQTADGAQVRINDDRGSDVASTVGGSSLDPAAILNLAAGEYTVSVTEAQGIATQLIVQPRIVEETLTVGQESSVTIPEDGFWMGAVNIGSDGDYTVRVTGTDGGDAVLATIDAEGESRGIDNSRADSNPVLHTHFPSGATLILLGEQNGWESEASVVVEPTP